MKNLFLLMTLFLLLISCGNKVYNMVDYQVNTLDGVRTVTLYDRDLGEEQTVNLEFLKSIPKKSLHYYKALCGNDTVTLLDLNPKVGEVFKVGDTVNIKVRSIRSLRILYWELPYSPLVYCFEKDTIWFSRDDRSPKYILMDENVIVKHGQRHIRDGVEVWEYDDGRVIKTQKINASQKKELLPMGKKGELSLYDNLTFEDGVCCKQLSVSFLAFGKNPLNGQFSEGLSQVFSKEDDIPSSSISFIDDNQEYYISLSKDCDCAGEDYCPGDIITVQIVFYQNVKEPYDYIYPFAMIVSTRGVKAEITD